jgi:hypothetical protein
VSAEFDDVSGRPPRGEFDDVVGSAGQAGEFDDVVGAPASNVMGPPRPRDIPGTVAYGARQAAAGTMGAEKEPPGFFQETPGQAISQFARTTKQSFTKPYPKILGGPSASEAIDAIPPEAFSAYTTGAGLTGVPPDLIKGATQSIAGAADFMTSPAGLMTAPLAGATGVAGTLVKGGFGYLGGQGIVEGVKQTAQGIRKRDPAAAGEGLGKVLMGGAMVAPIVSEGLGALDVGPQMRAGVGQGLTEGMRFSTGPEASPEMQGRNAYAQRGPVGLLPPVPEPPRRVLVTEPPTPEAEARARYVERGPAGLLGRKPIIPPAPGEFDDVVAAKAAEPPPVATQAPESRAQSPQEPISAVGPVRGYPREPAGEPSLAPENLQAAFRLPDGSVIRTGKEHALPRGWQDAERGFTDRSGNFLTLDELQGRIVAGRGAGEQEIQIPRSEAADEALVGRPTTLQPSRVELSSLKSAARDRGYADPADVPTPLLKKISARRNLELLAQTVEEAQGTVGRYRSENYDGTFNWLGQKSALPKSLQQGFSYADVANIIRSGLANDPLTPKRARFFRDLQDYALKKDGPISAEELQAFLSERGLGLDTLQEKLRAGAERPLQEERAAIQEEQGDTSFPREEVAPIEEPPSPRATFLPQRNPADVLRERGQTLVSFLNREPEEAARAELLASQPPEVRQAALDLWQAGPPGTAKGSTYEQLRDSLKQPIEEFSAAASEAQRAVEERDAAAGKGIVSSGPMPVQGSLGLSEDYGRKLDQRDIDFEANVPQRAYTGGRSSGDFGAAVRDPFGPSPASQPTRRTGGRGIRRGAPTAQPTGIVGKFVQGDIAPAAKGVFQTLGEIKDDVHTLLSPMTRGEAAKIGGGILREKAADLALKTQRAQRFLDEAEEHFDRQIGKSGGKQTLLGFTRVMESGGRHADPAVQRFADVMRGMLDERVAQVQALGTGKLQKVIENYFPHIWKEVQKAEEWLNRRSLEGGKSFTKRRTIPTTEEGINAGLEPVDWNPVRLELRKIREMDKYVMAHEWLKESQKLGAVQRFSVTQEVPAGWEKINDKIGTIYGSGRVPLEETVDARLMERLEGFAKKLGGIRLRRETGIGGPSGVAFQDKGIVTKFASPMGVLTHEIGHILDHRFGLWDAVTGLRSTAKGQKTASLKERATINEELRDLADLRHEGTPHAQLKDTGYGKYIRHSTEKVANLIDAYVNHRSLMRDVAPTVTKRLEEVIAARPALSSLKEMRPSLTIGTREGSVSAGGLVVKGYYAAPHGLATVINNYLSPGLLGKAAYRGWRGMSNTLNQAQLGLSAFHAGMTSIDAVVSKVALGLEQGSRGKLGSAATSIAGAPFAWATNVIRGDRAIRDALGAGPLTADVETVLKAGGRFQQDAFYSNNVVRAMQRAWRQGNYLGAGLRAPFAVVEATAKPLMEWLVPRQKLGSFLDLAHAELKRLGLDATPEQTRFALGRAWDSIDNRMGQLVYDNLFWDRTTKDLGMASVRSLGWNIGTVRELGGAAFDVANIGKRIVDAKAGKLTDPLLTHRMAYAMALPLVVGTMGGITTYLLTGEHPRELKDYFFPRTGRTNPDGTDERISFPSYVKDVAAFKEQGPKKTVLNKLHPMVSAIGDMLDNKDFYGTEIRHPDDPALSQVGELAEHVGKQFEPFSFRGYRQARENQDPKSMAAAAFLGITRAPKYVTQTPAQKEMDKWRREHAPEAPRTREQAEHAQTRRQIETSIRHGDIEGARAATRRGIVSGKLGETDADTIANRLQGSPQQNTFKNLPTEEQLKVWNVSTTRERDQFRPLLADRIQRELDSGAYEKKLPGEVARIKNGLRLAIQNDPGLRQALAE